MDWTIYWTIFWTIFWTILEGEHTIITEGGVGGRVLLLREGCETDYYYSASHPSLSNNGVLPLLNGPKNSQVIFYPMPIFCGLSSLQQ